MRYFAVVLNEDRMDANESNEPKAYGVATRLRLNAIYDTELAIQAANHAKV